MTCCNSCLIGQQNTKPVVKWFPLLATTILTCRCWIERYRIDNTMNRMGRRLSLSWNWKRPWKDWVGSAGQLPSQHCKDSKEFIRDQFSLLPLTGPVRTPPPLCGHMPSYSRQYAGFGHIQASLERAAVVVLEGVSRDGNFGHLGGTVFPGLDPHP